MAETHAADRSITISQADEPDTTVLLSSPSKAERIFSTPTKQQKAIEEYSGYNLLYVTEALSKLSDAILDPNTAIIASQALSRFLFILFSKSPNTCFSDEGHSQNFEIRLYDSEDEAAHPTTNSYKILTPIELAHHLAELSSLSDYTVTTAKELIETQHWRLDKCLRVVNCEGNKIKAIPDSLKILDNIIFHFNLYNEYSSPLINEYNQTQLELKLLNYIGEPLIYNLELVNDDTIQDSISAQVAKLLYIAFDLKAPENLSFYPVMDTGIVTYTSASGKKFVNYTFKNGKAVREFEKSQSSLDDKFLRDEDYDQKILAQKLVEMLYIGTSPFASFTTGFHPFDTNFLLSALEHMIRIAAIDYDMRDTETFHDEVISIFDELQPSLSSLDHSDLTIEASVLGDGSQSIDNILGT